MSNIDVSYHEQTILLVFLQYCTNTKRATTVTVTLSDGEGVKKFSKKRYQTLMGVTTIW